MLEKNVNQFRQDMLIVEANKVIMKATATNQWELGSLLSRISLVLGPCSLSERVCDPTDVEDPSSIRFIRNRMTRKHKDWFNLV
ncbi:hypothetical protein WICPIJ_005036 [Wickerhamomyces pijperi]|uniref:Uncharacterized protein n=1 Tax=Wickerhamomyces pijperi TaxID=599730 RepID=A0A9P8Q4D2_WICPI|nr:hypothetical protein WICPIJ_005036 [Wickerhamomyces pijperi]